MAWLLAFEVAAASLATASSSAVGPAAAAGTLAASPDDEFADDDIVVTGAPLPGGVPTDIPPETRIGRATIRSLGVDSVAEVLAAFAPQAKSLRGGREPIVLLDGRRIADRSEIDELPPESIRAIEVFPEAVALRYGFAPDRRVINVMLRPGFRALELQARGKIPLGEGRATYRAKAGWLRAFDGGRSSLDLAYRWQTPIDDGTAGTGADRRWRLPRTERLAAAGSYARRIGHLDLAMNGNGRWQVERWKLGRGGSDGERLDRLSTQAQGEFGFTLGAQGARRHWSMVARAEWWHQRTATREPGRGLSPVAGHSLRASGSEAQLDVTLGAPLARLPGGSLEATFGFGGALHRREAQDLLGGSSATVRQDFAYASAALEVPLAANRRAVLSGEGRLVVGGGRGVTGRVGLGLSGSPLAGLAFSASYSRERELPEFADLAEPLVLTPNVRLYDFATGSAAYVSRFEGGNPELPASRQRDIVLRVQFAPPAVRGLSLSLEYADDALSESASGQPGPTPQLEAAFPERFARDPAGALTAFDARPLAIADERRRRLRWGVNLVTPLGLSTMPLPATLVEDSPQGRTATDRLQFALYHTWTLQDVAVLRADTPRIDLLDGAAIGDLGGTSRHGIEAQLGYAARRFGFHLSGKWRSPTYVAGAGRGLDYRCGLELGLSGYLSVSAIRDALGLPPWIKGSLFLTLDNLLGTGTRIRDADGAEVDYYYRAPAGDTGRAFRVTFKKSFY